MVAIVDYTCSITLVRFLISMKQTWHNGPSVCVLHERIPTLARHVPDTYRTRFYVFVFSGMWTRAGHVWDPWNNPLTKGSTLFAYASLCFFREGRLWSLCCYPSICFLHLFTASCFSSLVFRLHKALYGLNTLYLEELSKLAYTTIRWTLHYLSAYHFQTFSTGSF